MKLSFEFGNRIEKLERITAMKLNLKNEFKRQYGITNFKVKFEK